MSIMTDFDTIWRTQDEIRTVVNAVLGECIWNLSYNERRMAIELELTQYLGGGVSVLSTSFFVLVFVLTRLKSRLSSSKSHLKSRLKSLKSS